MEPDSRYFKFEQMSAFGSTAHCHAAGTLTGSDAIAAYSVRGLHACACVRARARAHARASAPACACPCGCVCVCA
eukprot:12883113-Alexandrium_andersonii.AAC.1